MTQLNCLIEGDDIVFTLIVEDDVNVSILKGRIKEKRVLDSLKGVDPHTLELWKPKDSNPIVAEPDDTLIERIGLLGHDFLKFADKLGPTRTVVDIFPAPPPRDCVHIIVKVPSTGEPFMLVNAARLIVLPPPIHPSPSLLHAFLSSVYLLPKYEYVITLTVIAFYPTSHHRIHVLTIVGIRQDKRKHGEDGHSPLKRPRMDIASAPSALAEASRFKQIVGPERAIALNRPFEPLTIPLVLLHEAFAIFKDRCEKAPSERALICLNELAPIACQWYGLELERRTEIQSILGQHMGLRLHEQNVPGTEFMTDGNLAVIVMPAAIRACKKEHGDVLNRAILYYANFLSKAHEDPRRFYNFNTRFPSILMIDMGSYLGFYGAVWDGERIRVEPLTPIFDLSTHLKETKARWMIAASFDAFMVAANSIEAHYKSIEAEAKVNPTPPEGYNQDLQKARGYPFLTSYEDNGQEINFMYNERLHNEKLVFSASVVNQPDSDEFIVKFTPWYSEDAHNCLASHDLAPRLRRCVRIPADWIAVIMDKSKYLGPFDLILFDGDNEKIRHKVTSAVRMLHQEGFVHGDIRELNILIDPESRTSDDVKIHLIDFDWAGPIGEAKYPADVNKITMRRPDGVEGGGFITKEHDIEMASLLFA